MIKSSCQNCGRSFLTQPARTARGHGKFCSRSCAVTHYWGTRRSSQPLPICRYCKASFIPGSHPRREKYCSKNCAAKDRLPPPPNKGNFYTGRVPWNKGLKGYMAGRTVSRLTGLKIGVANAGPNAPNWKGGISPENHRIRQSSQYSKWRTAVFKRDNYTCQFCGDRSRRGHRIVLNADHIKPFALFPELRFVLSNGRTLCEPCHRKTPTYGNGSIPPKEEKK